MKLLFSFFLFLTLGFFLSASPVWKASFEQRNFVERGNASDKTKSYFKGEFPFDWHEDFTHWTKGRATSQILEENGSKFVRICVEKNPVQFSFRKISGCVDGKFYLFRVSMRCSIPGGWRAFLRLGAPPYSALTPQVLFPVTQREWVEIAVPVRFSWKTNVGYNMIFYTGGTGVIDIRDFRIEPFEPEKQLRLPPANAQNYLRNSRLPFGLQTGWTIATTSFGTAEPSGENGPSGERALKLKAGKNAQITVASEPFCVPDPEREYTVSFSFRGSSPLWAGVLSGRTSLVKEKELSPSREWKRCSFDFKASEFNTGCVLSFRTRGVAELDAFRVAPKGETEYRSRGECELAFTLPQSDASEARVQFHDEPALLQWKITGKSQGTEVRFKVENLYRETKELPAASASSGTLNYDLFPNRPYGQFRIEGQVYRNGKAVSPVNEFIVTRVRRPVFWGKDAPESPFGTHLSQVSGTVAAVKAGGVNWCRIHDGSLQLTGWYFLEPAKGKWRFRDAEIALYRKWKMGIFGQLGTTPVWASWKGRTGEKHSDYFDAFYVPVDHAEFARYVETVVGRYRNDIREWFIWNEPWLSGFFHRTYNHKTKTFDQIPEAGKLFAELSKTAYLAAKKVNPEVLISGFNCNVNPQWGRDVYKAGGYDFCDEVDYHHYGALSGGPGDSADKYWKNSFQGILEARGKIGKPVINSEASPNNGATTMANVRPVSGLAKHSIVWRNQEEYNTSSETLVRFLTAHLTGGVKRVFLYSAHTAYNFSVGGSFQTLVGSDGYPLPELAAHSALALRIEGKKFQRYQKKGDLLLAIFSDGSRTTAIKLSGSNLTPAGDGIRAFDLYGNPLTLPLRNYPGIVDLDYLAGTDVL